VRSLATRTPAAPSQICVREVDRDDLVLEAPVVARSDRAAMGFEGEGVELLAREPPLVGDHLGRDPLRHDLPALEELVRKAAAV